MRVFIVVVLEAGQAVIEVSGQAPAVGGAAFGTDVDDAGLAVRIVLRAGGSDDFYAGDGVGGQLAEDGGGVGLYWPAVDEHQEAGRAAHGDFALAVDGYGGQVGDHVGARPSGGVGELLGVERLAVEAVDVGQFFARHLHFLQDLGAGAQVQSKFFRRPLHGKHIGIHRSIADETGLHQHQRSPPNLAHFKTSPGTCDRARNQTGICRVQQTHGGELHRLVRIAVQHPAPQVYRRLGEEGAGGQCEK